MSGSTLVGTPAEVADRLGVCVEIVENLASIAESLKIVAQSLKAEDERQQLLTLTPAQVAPFLDVCEQTVKKLIKDRRLPHVRLTPSKTVISKVALKEWLAAESRASTVLAELADECPF